MARSGSDNPDAVTSGVGDSYNAYSNLDVDDDAGYGSSSNNTKKRGGGTNGSMNSHNSSSIPILNRLFVGFEDDAPGSVHRAWAVTVLFMVIFFTVSIAEGEDESSFFVLFFQVLHPPPRLLFNCSLMR